MGVLNEALFNVVEVLNFSVIGIIICFICMVAYILSITIPEDGLSSVVRFQKPAVPKVKYDAISIPFSCILEKSQNGYEKCLSFTLKNRSSCLVRAHWHVCANSLKSILYLAWPQFSEQIKSKECLKSSSDYDAGYFSILEDGHQTFSVPVPELPRLGEPPRTKFPLILYIERSEVPEGVPNQVGGLVCILHVSDEDCPMPNVILYQYLKQYSGQLTQLMPLYTQSSEADQNKDDSKAEETVSVEEACVICKVLKPVKALLPCRHVCVCTLCFPHIEDCPMCRSPIEAFFLTDEPEAERQEQLGREEGNRKNEARHRSFLNNMNGVLNAFLGIEQNE